MANAPSEDDAAAPGRAAASSSGPEASAPEQRVRLDIWLWRARFFKSRRLAGDFIAKGRVRLTRDGLTFRAEKPHNGVAPGDVLCFAIRGRLVRLGVISLGVRRGPAQEARGLYHLMDDAEDEGTDNHAGTDSPLA